MDPYNINSYDFDLPPDRIAQFPKQPRHQAKLLVVKRREGTLEDMIFWDLTRLLGSHDVLVLNETRVLPARLLGVKAGTGAKVELLLLNRMGEDQWQCLVKPARRLTPGSIIRFPEDQKLEGEVLEDQDFAGGKLIRFRGYQDWYRTLERIGKMPLPPYIKRPADESDAENYQTVYAKKWGSAAAPTAGLHFTRELLEELIRQKVEVIKITLHIGLGTFRPVETENIKEHVMHSEYYELGEQEANALNRARSQGKRIIAVGTTSVRTLETTCGEDGRFLPGKGTTDMFIYPGYRFRAVEALITNFHLPKSSLLMLVSAFAGIELTRKAYRHALEKDYRFFSYGDAMFII